MNADADSARRRLVPLLILGLLATIVTAYLTQDPESPFPVIADDALASMRPAEAPPQGHASSSECRECHEHNHSTWFASYHRTMTQVVTPTNILGDFNHRTVEFADHEQRYQLELRDGMPWVNFAKPVSFFPIGKLRRDRYPLVLSTGSHHMQLYWMPVGNERSLAIMPLAYLREEGRWIPRNASFLTPPAHGFEPETSRWNETCIGCHTTFGDPGQLPGRTFASSAAEFGISCEACHGPAAAHVEHRRRAAAGADLSGLDDPILNPARLDHRHSAAVCGICHSVFQGEFTGSPPPGDLAALDKRLLRLKDITTLIARAKEAELDFPAEDLDLDPSDQDDTLADLKDGTFWPDGNVRVAGREYTGLIESGCFTRGEITCMSCHDLHQSRSDPRPALEWAADMIDYRRSGDQACVHCHTNPDLASSKHTHHDSTSAGSRCDNCHMPHTTYGLLKAVRSHTIDSPSVASDLVTGRPNACNLCHLDKPLAWTAGHLSDWFGQPTPDLTAEHREFSHAATLALKGDAPQRALIAWHMSWPPAIGASGSDWLPPYLGTLLRDRYGAVRHIAEKSLRKLPGYETMEYDFLSARNDLNESSQRIVETWGRSTNRTLTAKPAVLIGENGRLKRDTFNELHHQRDDRDIRLAE